MKRRTLWMVLLSGAFVAETDLVELSHALAASLGIRIAAQDRW